MPSARWHWRLLPRVRVSRLASTIAVIAVGIAGVVLAAAILGSPSELWTTQWGRLLLIKIALVVVAAAGGAYNHSDLLPQLETDSADGTSAASFRAVVTTEAVILTVVAVVTALLMEASL